MLKQSKVEVVAIGGKSDPSFFSAISQNPVTFIDDLTSYLKSTANFDSETSAAPIGFEVVYAYDNQPLIKADTVNFSEQIRLKKFQKGGLQDVIPLPFSSETAKLVAGDTEMNTDDWTYTKVNYTLSLSPDSRAVVMALQYEAREGNKNQTVGDSFFRIIDTISLYQLDGNEKRKIKAIACQVADTKEKWHQGKNLFGFQQFPDYGALSGVSVSFDKAGREDLQAMKIKGTVNLHFELSDEE